MVSSVGAVRFILFLYPSPCPLFCCCCRPRHPCSRASQPTEAGKAVTATSILIPGMYIRIYPDLSTVYFAYIYQYICPYSVSIYQGFSRCTTAPWCGFSLFKISRGGSVLFFMRIVRCGAVRCGFHFFWNHMVRCDGDFLLYGAMRYG